MKNFLNRITIDEKVLNGKPAIRGKRIAVQTILDYLSAGDNVEDILRAYPSLEKEDITACLQFASEMMNKNYTFKTLVA